MQCVGELVKTKRRATERTQCQVGAVLSISVLLILFNCQFKKKNCFYPGSHILLLIKILLWYVLGIHIHGCSLCVQDVPLTHRLEVQLFSAVL